MFVGKETRSVNEFDMSLQDYSFRDDLHLACNLPVTRNHHT
jgi:hypothetical protein